MPVQLVPMKSKFLKGQIRLSAITLTRSGQCQVSGEIIKKASNINLEALFS